MERTYIAIPDRNPEEIINVSISRAVADFIASKGYCVELLEPSAPLATDNTLPPEPEDVLRKIEDKYVCRLEEDAAAIAVYAMQAYAKQSREHARREAIQQCIETASLYKTVDEAIDEIEKLK